MKPENKEIFPSHGRLAWYEIPQKMTAPLVEQMKPYLSGHKDLKTGEVVNLQLMERVVVKVEKLRDKWHCLKMEFVQGPDDEAVAVVLKMDLGGDVTSYIVDTRGDKAGWYEGHDFRLEMVSDTQKQKIYDSFVEAIEAATVCRLCQL